MDAETAHHRVTGGLRTFTKIWGAKSLLKSLYTVDDPRLEREVFGLKFKNPVGLAAGFDKNAVEILASELTTPNEPMLCCLASEGTVATPNEVTMVLTGNSLCAKTPMLNSIKMERLVRFLIRLLIL